MRYSLTLPALCGFIALQAQNYQLSPGFGTGGAVHVDVFPGGDAANSHALYSNGKLLITGFGYYIGLNSFHTSMMRIDTVCGALDPTFGGTGTVAHTHEQRTICLNMTLQPDGRIVCCGMIAPDNAGSQQWPGVFRYLANGSVDSTFNGTGYNRLQFNGGTGSFSACFVNADGTITCTAASFASGVGAMRFMADGTLDPTFGAGGTALLPANFTATEKGSGVMRPDGSVMAISITYTGNGSDNQLVLAQFDANGAPDPNFGSGGLVLSPVFVNGGAASGGMGASLLPDGRLLVSCTGVDVNGGFLMARFLPNGTLDSTYATNGVSLVTLGSYILGNSHTVLADGSTLQFGTTNGHGLIIARDAEGQVLDSFGTNGLVEATFSNSVEFLGGLQLPSGRIIAYGNYAEEILAARLTTDPEAEHFVDLGADIAGCEGTPVVLDAGSAAAYVWNDNSTEQTLAVTASGTYSVMVTDANGCMDADVVDVTLWPPPSQPMINVADFELSTTAVGDLQWYLDGGAIGGATGPAYSVTENGDYTVSVTDVNGCTSTSAPVSIINVGIGAVNDQGAWSVSPNPATDHLTVTGPVSFARTQASVIDGTGRRIALAWTGTRTLGVDQLAPGSYLLELTDGAAMVRQRFMKN